MGRSSLPLSLIMACSMMVPAFYAAQNPPSRIPDSCGERVFALTADNNLITFNSNSPGSILSTTPITGLAAGESLTGIDFRPAVRLIYAVSDQSRIYLVDASTGKARPTAKLATAATGRSFGVDFNPVPDRLRVVSESDQNLRINVLDGATTVDGALAYASGDANAKADPNIVAAAYSNSFAGTTTTTLYGIDSNLDILVIQNPPNEGRLNTVGSLGVNVSDVAGFDIAAGSTRAFASLTTPDSGGSSLYTINLKTGAATLVGAIGGGQPIRDITVDPRRPLTAYAVTATNRLLTFEVDTPGTNTSATRVKGLSTGETIVGFDFRPANKKLYALGSKGRIYSINLPDGIATPVAASVFSPGMDGTAFGFDFNPVPDRIRLVSNTGQDLRLHPDTGAVAGIDGTLTYVAGDPNAGKKPNVVASAYTNNYAGTTATMLYGIDSNLDILVIQNPPNEGRLNTVGSLGVNASDVAGFDIAACDASGYAVLNLSGESVSKLFRINLATGAATLVGTLYSSEPIQAFAVGIK